MKIFSNSLSSHQDGQVYSTQSKSIAISPERPTNHKKGEKKWNKSSSQVASEEKTVSPHTEQETTQMDINGCESEPF